MRRIFLVILTLSVLVVSSVSAQTLGAVLTASQETPATTTPGFGNATVTFDSTRQNITVTITVSNLGSPITGFHIHKGTVGVPGSIVEDFVGLGGHFVGNVISGTFPVDPVVGQAMATNPADYYVNVHTAQFPGGAIRGQLMFVSGNAAELAADMRGSNETPPNSSTAFGSVLLHFDTAANTITWELNTSGIASPTLAHIHTGGAGDSNPPLISFVTSASAFTNGRAKGVVTGVDPAMMAAILANPKGYYFNVHSAVDPGGEIRGQLAPASESDIAVAGHVSNAIGQTFVTDARVFNPSYSTPAAALVEFFQAGSGANVTATNSMVVNIPARGTAILNDVAGPTGLNVTGTGALRVTSAESIAATSRIYTTSNGTFGQFVPAVAGGNGLRRGVMPQLSNTAAFRTNAGFFNPNPEPVTIRLELRDQAGNLVGQNTMVLPALSQQQAAISLYFPSLDLSGSPNLTLSFDAAAPVLAYASVADNASGDTIFIGAQPDSGVATIP